ncbi:unnamed protein product [Clonostachys rosea]|uniref:DUF6594 domain-containing protein n=1 Tax=Bionectria ochroleuca TaxID=29856 RepID=A0ABY6UXZ9_BIOOC|nr:unnamed protein product [Clonostachys rosea]
MPPFSNLQENDTGSSSNSPPSPTAIVPLAPGNGEQHMAEHFNQQPEHFNHQPEHFNHQPENFNHQPSSPVEGTRRIRGHRQRKSSFIAPSSPAGHSYSSVPSSLQSDVFSQDRRQSDSHRSWSPDQSIPGPSPYPQMIKPMPSDQQTPDAYGAGWPSSPGANNHMQLVGPGPGPNGPMMPSPMPHHEPQEFHRNPPISGYQQIAVNLAGEGRYPRIYPIYRRYVALNHRLLLHIQDELTVLEEELGRLDHEDARDRTQRDGIQLASRREEGKRGIARDELMKDIRTKFEEYRQTLAAFDQIQQYPRPTDEEIDGYKDLLFRDGGLIVENEARFIHHESDLVCLPIFTADEPVPPMKEVSGMPPSPIQSDITTHTTRGKQGNDLVKAKKVAFNRSRTLLNAAYVSIAAILAPILTFFVIPSFLGRMLIVFVAIGGVSAVVMSSGLLRGSDQTVVRDCVICAGVYGGIMAVLAGIC